jgi:hypothetical protein
MQCLRAESKNERDVISMDARRVLWEVQTSVSRTAEEDGVWYRDARKVLWEVQTSVKHMVYYKQLSFVIVMTESGSDGALRPPHVLVAGS